MLYKKNCDIIYLYLYYLLYLYLMKRQKIKKFFKKHLYVSICTFFVFWTVFGAYTTTLIGSQNASDVWSNNSLISFTWVVSKEWYYVNNKTNSAVINNYFKWYYYDSLYWYFKLDWSANGHENVRVIESTWKCTTWYGYKLWWKAFNEAWWYIDFNYSDSVFVYYCLDTGQLHWRAFSDYIWFQNFDWISLTLVEDITDLTDDVNKNTVFDNDRTDINNEWTSVWDFSIWWDNSRIDSRWESIFYIVK